MPAAFLNPTRILEHIVHLPHSRATYKQLTKALAKAFAPEITVNSVAPGVIAFDDLDSRAQRMVEATPARRAGTAEEVAGGLELR